MLVGTKVKSSIEIRDFSIDSIIGKSVKITIVEKLYASIFIISEHKVGGPSTLSIEHIFRLRPVLMVKPCIGLSHYNSIGGFRTIIYVENSIVCCHCHSIKCKCRPLDELKIGYSFSNCLSTLFL